MAEKSTKKTKEDPAEANAAAATAGEAEAETDEVVAPKTVSASPSPSKTASKPRKTTKRVGGHTVQVDEAPAAPRATGQCAVHGVKLRKDGTCPKPHDSHGWKAERS